MMTILAAGAEQACVAEVYSPPRVAIEAEKFGLQPGWSMDLTNGWDFRQKEDRERAKKYVEEEKPLLLIGSPMCTYFSNMVHLFGPGMDPKKLRDEIKRDQTRSEEIGLSAA